MTIHQISVFLENKYGKLSEVLALLAEGDIRIIAASVADTSDYGILRMIVNDPQRACQILKEHSVNVNMSEVFALISDSGADHFAYTFHCFTQVGISIEYMYCFACMGKSILVVRTSNSEAARDVIRKQNLGYVSKTDLMKL